MEITQFKQTVQELYQQKDSLIETITSLHTDLHTQKTNSSTFDQQKDSMKKTIASLRADLHTQKTNSSTFVDTVPRALLTDF